MCWDSEWWPSLMWCFRALRCFSKRDPKKTGKELSRGGGSSENPPTSWSFEPCGAELVDLSRAEHQARPISFGLQCQGCSQNLLDCWYLTVSQEQPIASLHRWIFIFMFFCHSLHLGFTFPTTPYSSFSLCLVIWSCCSRWTRFTELRRSLRSCYLSIPG